MALVTVDSDGEPVVARTVLPYLARRSGSGAIVVRRPLERRPAGHRLGGRRGGAAALSLPRGPKELLAGPEQSTFVVATSTTGKKSEGEKKGVTAAATLIKLDSTGHRAKGYGAHVVR